MSNYEITKNEYSVDVRRISDGMACGFMVQNVWNDLGSTYQADVLYKEGNTIPDGKKVGDVMIAGDTLPDGKKVGDVKVAGLSLIHI